jgi:hypothetical protein
MLNYFQPEVRFGSWPRENSDVQSVRRNSVSIPSIRKPKVLAALLREDDRENNSAHSCQFRADDAGPKTDRPHEAAIPDLSERLR